jgi:hypothetical protein
MTIQQAIDNFKFLVEDSVKSGGNAALTAMIRSSKPILNIHEAIKQQLIDNGVSTHLIFPPIGKRSQRLKHLQMGY